MGKIYTNRKAVSPVIATILMIMVVMAGMSILFVFVGSYAQNFQSGSGSAVKESLMIEDAWFKSDQNLYVWVYNIGQVDFKIDSIYINNAKEPFILYDSNHNQITQATLIKIGDHVQIQINSLNLGNSYTVKIVTTRGSSIEETYTTQN